MTNRWFDIDRPVLAAVYQLEERKIEDPKVSVEGGAISEITGVEGSALNFSLRQLFEDGLIDGHPTPQGAIIEPAITPNGLRALNEWPTADGLAEALPEILARLGDELQRQGDPEKAERFKDMAADVASGTLATVAAAAIRAVLGV